MIKYATALRLGTADAETILKRFTRSKFQHPTYRAMVELGKAIKTIFLCQYLHEEALRHEINDGLQVVENWNSANDFIFFGKGGEIATNRFEDQELAMLSLHLLQISLVYIKPTVSPLLTPVASPNILLLQSLPNSIPYRQAKVRRRKDAHRVGPAARGIVERLSRLPRRLPSDGGSSGRVRRALSTGAGDRSRPAPHASLPPGAAVPFATQECRGHRGVGRCRAPSHSRLHRYSPMGASTVAKGVGWSSGRSIGRA